jgi:hypothetical protein
MGLVKAKLFRHARLNCGGNLAASAVLSKRKRATANRFG